MSEVSSETQSNMVNAKNFVTTGVRGHVRRYFPVLVNVMFILSLIGVLLTAVIFANLPTIYSPYGHFNFTVFVMTLIGGWCATIIGFGLIYLLMDIRDAVEKTNH